MRSKQLETLEGSEMENEVLGSIGRNGARCNKVAQQYNAGNTDSLEAQGCRHLRFTTLRATFSAIQF